MYCSTCGTPLAPGLSYCNRCGMSLKERGESNTSLASAYLIAISIVGIAGLVLILGGAIALKNGALFDEEMIGIYMLMSFIIISTIEIFLCRQLSRISNTSENRPTLPPPTAAMPGEFRPSQQHALAEPARSVTENTTRTLEYAGARKEPDDSF